MPQRPRRFLDPKERTPLYEEAVAALRRLAEEHNDSDDVDRAFAEAMSDRFYESMEAKGLRETGAVRPWVTFHKGIGQEGVHQFPGDDHVSLWTRDGVPERRLSQPYTLHLETIRKMVEWADRYGLEFDISGKNSWHFPGHTMLVTWQRAQEHRRV